MSTDRIVYVLKVQREHEAYTTSSDIIGVYSNKERARKQMKKCFVEELEYWRSEFNYHDEDIRVIEGSDCCSIYDTTGGIEYTEFEINDIAVED